MDVSVRSRSANITGELQTLVRDSWSAQADALSVGMVAICILLKPAVAKTRSWAR